MTTTKILSEHPTGLTKVILVSMLELAVSYGRKEVALKRTNFSSYDMQWEKAYMKRLKGFDKSTERENKMIKAIYCTSD